MSDEYTRAERREVVRRYVRKNPTLSAEGVAREMVGDGVVWSAQTVRNDIVALGYVRVWVRLDLLGNHKSPAAAPNDGES